MPGRIVSRLATIIVSASLITLLNAVSSRVQAPTAQDFDRLFAHALELQQAGDLLGAIDTYKAALAITPDRADALSNLGAAYVRLGQFDDGIRQYEAAYYKSARPNEAIPQLKRVVSSDPESRSGHLILADCYLQTGQDQEVIALLKARERMFTTDLAYAYLLGTALLHTGDTAEGQKHIDRIFRAGESAEGHLLMGIAYLELKDGRSAKTELERAVQMNPTLPTAHSQYGRALLGLGDQEGAVREFRAELAVNINDFDANLFLGNIKKTDQQFADASSYLERATTIRPADLTARRLLATLRLQTGRVEEAVAMFESVEKDAPELIDVHVQLATAYNRLKRKQDADREKAIVDKLNAEAQAKARGGSAEPPER
ncbi:MAG: hypothetical protein DMF86_25640 [Acidobacteria bacterium]|nr:MAG: hypothetical protein DMF86_25640 [Acidobacteriota bacterium]